MRRIERYRAALAIAIASALAMVLGGYARADGSRPNILLIVTDDQGAQMGALGTPGLSTPNMDSIANGGTLFRNAFVPHPTCSVSRAAIMTGTLPHTNGTLVNVNEHFGPDPTTDPSNDPWLNNPNSPYNRNQIDDSLPTLIEELDTAGYRTALTSKLHMSRHDRFPFDVWIDGEINGTDVASGQRTTLQGFMSDSATQQAPFFAMVNIRSPHRPLSSFQTNSQPDPDPNVVEIPASLPQTPTVRNDWVQYLKAIQRTDDLVGQALQAVAGSGQEEDTVVIFMGDHGPAYHSAKWTPYDFGLRVPLAIKGPGMQAGAVSDAVVTSMDLMPTLLSLAGAETPALQHGEALNGVLTAGAAGAPDRQYVMGQLIHPSGLQERSIHGQRYHLIHRTNTAASRLVPADNRDAVWGNPVYQNTINQQANYPEAYELLRQIDNGSLGGTPREFELYDLENDRWEMSDLATDPAFAPHLNRMKVALQVTATQTGDGAVNLYATAPQPVDPGGPSGPVSVGDDFTGRSGSLNSDSAWTTRIFGNGGADFTLVGGVVDAAPGGRVLATYDGVERSASGDFTVAVETQFNGTGVGGGVVFGYVDTDNFFELQLLDGRSTPGGTNKDVRLIQRSNGVDSQLLFTNGLPNYGGGWYDVIASYTSETSTLALEILDDNEAAWFSDTWELAVPLDADSGFGISTWSSNVSEFDNFSIEVTDGTLPGGLPLLGDFNGDGELTPADADALVAAYGASSPETAQFNLVTPDESINADDLTEWLRVIVPLVNGVGPAEGDFNLDGDIDLEDYAAWAQSYGAVGQGSLADANFDGVVDGADYTVWRERQTAEPLASGGLIGIVPEPSALLLSGVLLTARLVIGRVGTPSQPAAKK